MSAKKPAKKPRKRGVWGTGEPFAIPKTKHVRTPEQKEKALEAVRRFRTRKKAAKVAAEIAASASLEAPASDQEPAPPAVPVDPAKLQASLSLTAEELRGAKTLLAAKKARENFLDFILFMTPDPNKPDDPFASRYVVKPHHRMIAEIMQEVEAGIRLRQTLSIPPQFGKSEPISRMFAPWFIGRNPYRNYMFGTYSQDFANDFGGQVRAIMQSDRYKLVFPDVRLRSDSKAKDHMTTEDGGQMSFIGRGGAGSGKPADVFVIDDPIKDDAEAQSDTIREATYQWYTKVAYARCHAMSAIVIVHTRWHEDDIIGRLTDPEHPKHDKDVAAAYSTVNIPAVLRPGAVADALGIKCNPPSNPIVIKAFGADPIASLWEERFTLDHLASAYLLNKEGFTALYLGKPTAEDGDYFKKENFIPYLKHSDLPVNLRKYGASDLALTEKQKNDPTCMGCVGVDEHGEIWLLPDLVWKRMESDSIVDEWIALMKRHKPSLWWAENDNINKTIGPFLRKRMRAEKVFGTHVVGMPIHGDKKARARSIQGMSSLKMIHVPVFAPWWPAALRELLKFPNGTHDDFVDFISWVGRGLDSESNAASTPPPKPETKTGTLAWVKKSAQAVRNRAARATATAGW